MSNTFFATLIPGAEELAAAILRQRLPDLALQGSFSGALVFSTAVPYSDLNLFCFHNIFRVLFRASAPPSPAGLEKFLRALPAASIDWPPKRRGKARTFRLVVSCKNQLVSVSKAAKTGAEKLIAARTGLRLDRSLPDQEFWALVRDNGQAWFLQRLSRHRAYDKVLHPGELHPELAYMMCWLTAPKPTDVVADPFCGYGAIPLQRCKRFPFARMYASDNAPAPLAVTREKLGNRPHVDIAERDALTLSRTLPEALDAVITDPPWGLYEQVGMELGEFYRLLLQELARALKPGGRVVVLTAAKDELLSAAEAVPQLTLNARYNLLVSGKKAGLFLLNR
jgi:tRNA (guanine6-N2)-methyltransferase